MLSLWDKIQSPADALIKLAPRHPLRLTTDTEDRQLGNSHAALFLREGLALTVGFAAFDLLWVC